MPLTLPTGKTFAVALTFDLDAQCLWMGMLGIDSPSYHSRGEFGALVGVDRILALLADIGITATWCIPGHSLVTFPQAIESILAGGHEIAAHGCYHESIPSLEPDDERRLMEIQLAQHEQIVGAKPRGYRSPAWDFSEITGQLLVEHGFEWDSSLMASDFEPYHPRPVGVNFESASTFGEPFPFLELPVSYTLDDAPDVEYIAEIANGLGDHLELEARWREIFDYGLQNSPGGLYTLTMHPQTIGRSHHLLLLERLLLHMTESNAVQFVTLSEAHDAWLADPTTSTATTTNRIRKASL
ncbi:polysaccharide deacetylase family protein [Compostimonas suwonensis]|uniref:Polysaccharide deacetylase n=1 Tax=Compostimonas suwonensis TaxID=1048394 RepID=A0A2M9BUT2_9MICO|nr:polysaccharide deacetylase [Compostimonas suwonensis]PJJ61706.1 polysaccharide deacetylase [Compostimonas suwonensis]